MASKQDMAAMLDGFEAAAAKEHEEREAKATVADANAHGLSLSAFFRLAADEYIANHDW